MISGFNKGISDMLASLGRKPSGRALLGRAGRRGPGDPNPWRRRPPITVEEANRLAQLPTIAFVVVDENTSADIDSRATASRRCPFAAATPTGRRSKAANVNPGRSFTHLEDARTPTSP